VVDGIGNRHCLDAAAAQGARVVQGRYFGEGLTLEAARQLLDSQLSKR
jgi:EAL domain-containing protein (putative c-di-GMP-specific phosphodiesterase class I)